jgi:peptide/nickel transport system substrate-binding protein
MASALQPKVFLAGRVAVETDGVVIDDAHFPGRQGRLLFAYLVAEQGRPVPRDELAEALWGEAPPATWEKALTVIVSKLRSLLADQGIDGTNVLTSAFGCYRLDLPQGTWIDVIVAANAASEAEAALTVDDPEKAKDAAALAESLLRQPFLPGEAGTWVEEKRRELTDIHDSALNALADAYLRSGEPQEAVKWAEQAIAIAPFRETGYRRLMEAHVAAGNGAEALRVYERCRRLLAEELGAYPSPETESVYRELLEEPSARVQTEAPQPPSRDAASLSDPEREPESAFARPALTRVRRRRIFVLLACGTIAAAAAVTTTALLHGRGGPRSAAGGSRNSRTYTSIGAHAVVAVGLSTGRVAGSTQLGASPGSIAYGQGSVWVTMPNHDSVSRIDPKTNAVEQTIGAGGGPTGIAVGGGFVWVANSLAGTVSQIDPQTNGGQVVGIVAVGNGPTAVAYGLDGVWVANSVDRTVVRIDPRTGATGRPIPVDAGADAIAVGDGAVWATSQAAGVLSRIDPAVRRVTARINVGNGPVAVAVGPGAVWVANSRDATVSRIDPATDMVTPIQVGEGPSGVAVAPDGRSVWVSNELAGTLSQIDPALNRVVKTQTVGDLPQGVAVGAATMYVAVRGASGAHRGGTLTVAVANPSGTYDVGLPKSLDPANGYTAWELLTLTNDGLVGYGRSGGAESSRVVPDLALTLPAVSDGGRTYTFQLRPGIRYSTGDLVRPADVRRGIERALIVGGGTLPGSYLVGIVGAKGCVTRPKHCDLSRGIVADPSSDTVTFHLTVPDPDFLYKLALPIADALPADTPLEPRLPLPATGPYKIAGYDVERGVVRLVRNSQFQLWSAAAQPAGFPDRIVERFGYTGESAVRAVERGTADITADGPDQTWSPALASTLRTRYSSRLYRAAAIGTTAVWLNTRLHPFDDLRVRQALNYAVDRNHLIELAGGAGVAQVGCQVLSPNTDGYRRYCPYTLHPNPAGSYNGPNPARARQLVAASGTKGQSITVWFYDIPIGRRNGAYLVSVLRSLGYKARLRTVPHTGSTWRPNRQAGVGGWGNNYPSPNNFFSPLFTCRSYDPARPSENANVAAFCSGRIDAEIARARALQSSDPSAASRLWSTIDRQITDQALWVVIRTQLAPDFVSRRTGNYTYCYLSGQTGSAAACLDQLWVR